MTDQERAEACAAAMWACDAASQGLGLRILRVAPGKALLEMTLTETMTNGHGTAHGGYLFAFADSAFAFACNTYDDVTVAQHCSVTFIAPGAPGDRLTAHAREVSRRGRSGIYDVTVARADGTVLAEFRGHSRSLDRRLLDDSGSADRYRGEETS